MQLFNYVKQIKALQCPGMVLTQCDFWSVLCMSKLIEMLLHKLHNFLQLQIHLYDLQRFSLTQGVVRLAQYRENTSTNAYLQ